MVRQCAGPQPDMKAGCIFQPFWGEPVALQPSGQGGTNRSLMPYSHGDRVHYTIADLGSGASAENGWIKRDSSESLSVVELLRAGPSVPAEWDRYGTCALASSAFPIGLAPVTLHPQSRDI